MPYSISNEMKYRQILNCEYVLIMVGPILYENIFILGRALLTLQYFFFWGIT